MEMHHVRRGGGKPLLLLHGLGGSWREWDVPKEAARLILSSTG